MHEETPFCEARSALSDAAGYLGDLLLPDCDDRDGAFEAAQDFINRALSILHDAGYERIEDGGQDTEYGWVPNMREVPVRIDAGQAEAALQALVGDLVGATVETAVVTEERIEAIKTFIETSFSESLKSDLEFLDDQPEPM